jgi:hypothetical protein
MPVDTRHEQKVGCTVLERGRGEPAEPIRDSRRKAAEPASRCLALETPRGANRSGPVDLPKCTQSTQSRPNQAQRSLCSSTRGAVEGGVRGMRLTLLLHNGQNDQGV